jgi:membrane-bound ClpP family serine protease
VVSEGTYIAAGTDITVVKVEGPRVVVRPIEAGPKRDSE